MQKSQVRALASQPKLLKGHFIKWDEYLALYRLKQEIKDGHSPEINAEAKRLANKYAPDTKALVIRFAEFFRQQSEIYKTALDTIMVNQNESAEIARVALEKAKQIKP